MNLNVAFAGYRHGHIFELWNRAADHPEVHILGSWEEDAATREDCEKRGVIFNYKNYSDILADDNVNLVAIGDYYGRRGSLAIEALKAGKHVIADKPICTSLDELDEIERLSKEKGLVVHSMFSLRYEKNIALCKKIIDSGDLGEVRNISFNGQHCLGYGSRPGWYFEEGKHGGTINDIAVHGIDMIRYTTGLEVKKICGSRTWNSYADKVPFFNDCAQFMLELSNKAGVLADVSYAALSNQSSLPTYWNFIIWGSKAMMTFSLSSPHISLYRAGEKEPDLITGEPVNCDNYADILAELSGKDGNITTAHTIASSRTTLQIQYAADHA